MINEICDHSYLFNGDNYHATMIKMTENADDNFDANDDDDDDDYADYLYDDDEDYSYNPILSSRIRALH